MAEATSERSIEVVRASVRDEAFDTRGGSLRFETPEGIDLVVSPAGPIVRGLATLIDVTITQIASLIALIVLAFFGEAGFGVYMILVFVVEWFYPVLFEVLRGGQTIGKRSMKLRVVNADATPISWNASLLRNLLRVVDVLPLMYVTGFLAACTTRRFQRLGDLAANTLVIHTAEDATQLAGAAVASEREGVTGAQPSPIPLSSEEQRAVLAYHERQGRLSDERSIELAEVLEPLTGVRGEEGRRVLLEIARGLAGDDPADASRAARAARRTAASEPTA